MIGSVLSHALSLADATKKYTRQQAQGLKKVTAPLAAGEIPAMQKISARRALRFYLHKTAAPSSDMLSRFGMAMLAGAGSVAAGTLMGASMGGVGSVYQKFQAGRMFKELQDRYPEIKKHPKAREYFDMIVAYAPSLLRHHAAIGDFLRRQLEYPMSSVEFLKQLADLESQVTKSQSESMGARFGQNVATISSKWLPPISKGGK